VEAYADPDVWLRDGFDIQQVAGICVNGTLAMAVGRGGQMCRGITFGHGRRKL
jgi:hypothetical protein